MKRKLDGTYRVSAWMTTYGPPNEYCRGCSPGSAAPVELVGRARHRLVPPADAAEAQAEPSTGDLAPSMIAFRHPQPGLR